MSEYGVSKTGFKRKRLDLLLQELNSEVKSIFGENFNVSPESPDGQINGVISESNANLWEIAEEAYNAFNPSAATGAALSNLVQLNGIERLRATKSRVQVTLSGTTGTIIPQGSLISTSDTGNEFSTVSEIVLDGAGNGSVFATSVDFGPVQALAGTLTQIDTPITGWSTVTNSFDADLGSKEETDVELRARRERSVAIAGQAMVDSIFAAVANIDGVTNTVVLENDTNSTDGNGLPPHSFQVIAVGGTSADIAQTIWNKKPAGIASFGNVSETILDSQGISHDISFSRPTEVDIYVEVTVTPDENYPSNGDELIKQAIVDYANGDLVDGRGFSLGDNVIYTRLYTPINSVQGHEIADLKIGATPSPTGTSNIIISATEIASFTVSNITVNS